MTAISSLQIRLHAPGNADALSVDTVLVPAPGPGELRLRHTAIGVNFVDVYHRAGRYTLPTLPATLGVEAVGVIESVGPGVSDFQPGQRVAYAGLPAGSYAQWRLLPADRAIKLSDTQWEALPDEIVAASLLRGITAHMLFTRVWPLQAGDTLLVHGAAGGLGLVLVQWAKALGARVIGTVSNETKATLADSRGLDRTVNYRNEDFVAAARDFGDGEGVHLAVDGIGGDTFLRTLDAIRPFGMVASVGQVRGEPPMLRLHDLGPARSIALARPSVFRFMSDSKRYREGAQATLQHLATGMTIDIAERYPLEKAAHAHRQLEQGHALGSLLLIP